MLSVDFASQSAQLKQFLKKGKIMKIKINGKIVDANEGETILDVATRENVFIPTLCYLKKVGATANCRMCLVEVKGKRGLVTACNNYVFDGMEVVTESDEIEKTRKTNLELLLSNHNYNCSTCVREGECELKTLVNIYSADENRFAGEKTTSEIDYSSHSITRDNSKCILCKKCVQVCSKIQGVDAIKETNRGFKTEIACAFNRGLGESSCVGCGQCVQVCPTGALSVASEIEVVESILDNDDLIKIVAPAPAVRTVLGEFSNLPVGAFGEALLPSVLRAVGFEKVFDVNFGADLTVVEEAEEFLEKFDSNTNLPMFTSCCPAWVSYAKKFHPEIVKNISTCKSPMMMLGAVVKGYYSKIIGVDASKIAFVVVMPCTAKKSEASKLNKYGLRDVDAVISVAELEKLIRKRNIDLKKIEPSKFDSILGESTGSGVIFGASGGVMEATLRALMHICSSDDENIEFREVRGLGSVKSAEIDLNGRRVNVAVVSGLAEAGKLIEKINSGEIKVDFVEVMACPGGCVNGGGMPIKPSIVQNYTNVVEPRAEVVYKLDNKRLARKSHQNAEVTHFIKWNKKHGEVVLHTKHQ